MVGRNPIRANSLTKLQEFINYVTAISDTIAETASEKKDRKRKQKVEKFEKKFFKKGFGFGGPFGMGMSQAEIWSDNKKLKKKVKALEERIEALEHRHTFHNVCPD